MQWDSPGGVETGVFIPRRDTNSVINVLVGGRLFPGEHHRADFDVSESSEQIGVAFSARDGSAGVNVTVGIKDELRGSKLFPNVAEASAFFERGSVGYPPRTIRLSSTDSRSIRTHGELIRPKFLTRTHRSSPTYQRFRTDLPNSTAHWSCVRSRSLGKRSHRFACRQ